MVELIGTKPRRYPNKPRRFSSKSKKSIKKTKENAIKPKLGKLPNFKPELQMKHYDEKKIKKMSNEILSNKLEEKEKQQKISEFVYLIYKSDEKIIVKKWILVGLEYCLKYGNNENRLKIFEIFKKNHENILRTPNGNKFVFKFLIYAANKDIVTIFKDIRSRILGYLIKEKSESISNKIYRHLTNNQLMQLFALFLNLNPDDNDIISKLRSHDKLSDLFPETYPQMIQYVVNYIDISIKTNNSITSFLAYIVDMFCDRIISDDIKHVIMKFSIEHIFNMFYNKHDTAIAVRFLRICSKEDYAQCMLKINEIVPKLTDPHLLNFLLCAVYTANQIILVDEIIFNPMLNKFDDLMNEAVFCKYISFIIQPTSKKMIDASSHNFIKQCDLLSETPSSSDDICPILYEKFRSNIIQYFTTNSTLILTCQYRANIFLQLIQRYSENPTSEMLSMFTSAFINVSALIKNADETLLFATKQATWIIVKLIHEDRIFDFYFCRALAESFDDKIMSMWLQNNNTSMILEKIVKLSPKDVANRLTSLDQTNKLSKIHI